MPLDPLFVGLASGGIVGLNIWHHRIVPQKQKSLYTGIFVAIKILFTCIFVAIYVMFYGLGFRLRKVQIMMDPDFESATKVYSELKKNEIMAWVNILLTALVCVGFNLAFWFNGGLFIGKK